MGKNDWHAKPDGTLGKGLVSMNELESVVNEFDDQDLHDLRKLVRTAEERVQTLHDRTLPMLTGSGFIVIDPENPRFDGNEIKDFEAAKARGSNVAYKSGTAIIYAPVLVMQPKRETADSQPSDLLKQLGLPTGTPVAIAAPKE